jgi:hypothetical protein
VTQEEIVSGGGIEVHRGLEHERAATIFHLLVRMKQKPTARITIESDEDSTIAWSNSAGEQFLEDIQCKKVETAQGPRSMAMDDWRSASLTKDAFVRFLTDVRRGSSPVTRLKEPNRFFTLMAYAEPVKATRKFMPPGVATGGFTRNPSTETYFPPDFAFTDDPDSNSNLGTAAERRKIRIVFLGAPQLQSFAHILMNKLYGVSSGNVLNAYWAIERLLYAHLDRDPEARTFDLRDIEAALQRYLLGTGRWKCIGVPSNSEDQAEEGSIEDIPLVRWSDFATGRFIKTAKLTAGSQALDDDSFVAILGYHGCGKTTLCKYLAHRFLDRVPGGKCFYLQVAPGDDLREETEIFQTGLHENWLYIIDDAHFAEDEVAAIAEAYLDFRLTHPTSAKLVIATTETSHSSARRAGPIDEARLVRFDFLSDEEMQGYLAQYRAYRGLGQGDDRGVIKLAGGNDGKVNMGAALVLLHAADERVLRSSAELALESPKVCRAIGHWLASSLRISAAEFESDVAPLLTVSSFGLPLTPAFSPLTERLSAAALLLPDSDEPYRLYRIRPEYASLAWIVSRQHLRRHREIFARYLQLHKALAPRLAQALSSDNAGRPTLQFLVKNHLECFVPADRSRGVPLAALAPTLTAIRRVGRVGASDYLRLCFDERRGGYPPASLHSAALLGLREDVRPATAFLDAAYRSDRAFARRLGTMIIRDEADLYVIFRAICDSPATLEQLLGFLRAGKNVDLRFGTKVCAQFVADPCFEEKWRELDGARNPSRLIRSLAILSVVNRRSFSQQRDQHLTEELVTAWIANVTGVAGFVEVLAGLRRLAARTASLALKLLLERHRHLITSLAYNAAGLADSSAVIASVSRIDRRVAISITREGIQSLARQVARETSYTKLGEGLGRVGRSTTPALASDLAAEIDVPQIADNIQREKRRFESVGRFLSQLAIMQPEIAEEVLKRLDRLGIYSSVHDHSLMDLAQLTRGFLFALPDEQHANFLSDIGADPALTTVFHNSLFEERALHKIADALSALAGAGLSASEIFRLFGTDEEGFRALMLQRVRAARSGAHSDLEFATLLFALGQVGPGYAAEAIENLVSLRDPDSPAAEGDTGQADAAPSPLKARLAKRFGQAADRVPFLDLAGTGALLHIASLIDDRCARALLSAREHFRQATSDTNLGRHAVFLLGVNNASRSKCLKLLQTVYTDSYLENLFEATGNPREMIQFVYTIQMVSLAECRRIGSGMIGGFWGDLQDYIASEADLSEFAKWAMSLAAIGRATEMDLPSIGVECSQYDTRLWALVDAAQALIAAGHPRTAGAELGPRIVEQARQARSIRKLSHCVQLWLKAEHVAQALGQPRILESVAEFLLPQALRLLRTEEDHVSTAYAISLWLACDLTTTSQRDSLREYRKLQILRAGLANRPMIGQALCMALLRVPESDFDLLLAKTSGADWPAWAHGLLQLALDIDGGVAAPRGAGDFPIDLDQNSLKFALACYAKQRAVGRLTAEEEAEIPTRSADETSSPIRSVLNAVGNGSIIRARRYDMWNYLRRTVLGLDYLDWEDEVHKASTTATFHKHMSANPSAILHAAE